LAELESRNRASLSSDAGSEREALVRGDASVYPLPHPDQL
jgi:hypothetical protein